MAQTKELERELINQAASHYLSDQEEGDLYDASLKLLKASEEGDGDKSAMDYVLVWQPLEYKTVDEILDLIECAKDQLEEDQDKNPIRKIDFPELRKQKESLSKVINNTFISDEQINDLTGILHLIDSIQDYAVDELGYDEKIVFKLENE